MSPTHPADGRKRSDHVLPLNMATDSIDDMYDGCRSEAAGVIDQFGVFEWHVNRNFSRAWAFVEKQAKKPAHKHLGEDHAKVLYMYTNDKLEQIQRDFDKAVKSGRHTYSTYGFKYHYLYFYLTDAIQVLRQNQTLCRTSYHRTGTYFDRNIVNREIRFGTFTLATSSKDSFDFSGNVSCFQIFTCFGAKITYYSASNQKGQVLIPPYEVFKVTDIVTDSQGCKVVYKLQSIEIPRKPGRHFMTPETRL
ncbi:ecto-ADP-ribosyltransferase 4-like [Polymixia lowei]